MPSALGNRRALCRLLIKGQKPHRKQAEHLQKSLSRRTDRCVYSEFRLKLRREVMFTLLFQSLDKVPAPVTDLKV